ncbi:MAG TPA: 1-deoxy-D-xylulose-5-phosphate synthase [Gammaproteobacteria bacterium]|jgi:1-deoxy-D-xylulose-5-phosphate synthase|nr:1-deoxy-D-xylulose-5-phosphate synthase [Acidiferrobacteraceae bacterium]MDP6397637.1 1-deoxy-D-xylulose-5-phosphate synthase [Arenicellales bacterium]MDP6790455.1 1-deoxy-D-xylulose-5-phosphate synthase [Arenicellales bacterium]MDP6917694.1 1-deoxy-D-xylulose-5-phosphate synthase [Arenicellales bacterium]HCX86710.1 1-deoxy-D-xylulose-5-phosphate synthase [Gammaproteobacteria bacterium]|tara:strand:- start:57649 stop:59535 length:1887 start_codon:yes stop_codon:yes gene_type:complete
MTVSSDSPLLDTIDSPADLRQLAEKDLKPLADELRHFLIDVTSETGGHLAPGLGAIELTVALHYVFNTPNDRLVWDIGHQAYPHKILTGRRREMRTIRKAGGLSGFLKRSESEYDSFGAGHSSTSISAALGMAVSARLHQHKREVVAIIGDGALTAGQAMEALYNAGDMDADLLVILNDNEMSISRNVGAMSNYLARILSGRAYTSVREGSKTVLGTAPPVRAFARRWEEHLKGMVMPSTLFEELGFNYIGPIDGHDIHTLVATLQNMKAMNGPRFLHIVTQKGKGFEPAEGEPIAFHGVGPFDPSTGKVEKKSGKRTYTQVFGDWLCDMAQTDDRLIVITPAMREGSGLVRFSEQYPDRYFDVGIAEQHALTFAAGTACDGLKPVVAIYSTFLQRAYDQLIHDISVQHLDVTLAIDRAGIVGADGPTHQGTFDLSFLRCIPGMVIFAPSDEAECRDMLCSAFLHEGPAAVRYPRGSGSGAVESAKMSCIPIGKAEIRRKGEGVALLAFGTMLAPALQAAQTLNATVVNMRSVKPLDVSLILEIAESHELLVTIEENTTLGGAGAGVSEVLSGAGCETPLMILGLPDQHVEQGDPAEVLAHCGLDATGICRAVQHRRPLRSVASRSGA